MNRSDPLHVLPWLISRASGVVALVLITLGVTMGLAMAAGSLRRAGVKRIVVKLHEHIALLGLTAIAVHGLALLGDHWLHPGWRGLVIPFAMSYRPQFTGLGVIAGYLAATLGPSFYLRRRIGARRWRRLHRVSAIIWLLAAVHTLGAGSDAVQPWLQAIVFAPLAPITYLLVLRLLRPRRDRSPLRRAGEGAHVRSAPSSRGPAEPSPESSPNRSARAGADRLPPAQRDGRGRAAGKIRRPDTVHARM